MDTIKIGDFNELIKRGFKIHQAFVASANDPHPNPATDRLIDDPDALAADAVGYAHHFMTGGMGRAPPAIKLIGRSGLQQNILMYTMPEDQQQMEVVAMISGLMKVSPIDACWVVSEAWVALVDETTDPKLRDLPPSQRRDRDEALLVAISSRAWHEIRTYKIERDAGGRVKHLPQRLINRDMRFMDGLMSNLFEIAARPLGDGGR
jgi:hypothetical protein